MRKRIGKVLLKAVTMTAMTAAIFIGTGKTAKADEIDDYMAMMGYSSVDDFDPDEYINYVLEQQGTNLNDYVEDVFSKYPEFEAFCKEMVNSLYNEVYGKYISVHNDMLILVNADRAANGSGVLVWSADLEIIAQQRAVEIFNNTQTEAYVNAVNSGNQKLISEIVHEGHREGLGENAIVSYYSGVKEATANDNWIASAGHHEARLRAKYTQYACASYTDPITGMETWVEVFADDNYLTNNSVFDYMRYAEENPDVAAALGQDRNLLYNHYITYGAAEGRKAYRTDGTEFRT